MKRFIGVLAAGGVLVWALPAAAESLSPPGQTVRGSLGGPRAGGVGRAAFPNLGLLAVAGHTAAQSSPSGGPNPRREETAALELPFSAADWVRPREPQLRYRWDAMCLGVHRVLRHERASGPAVPREQAERETAQLATALAWSAALAGHTQAEAEEASRAWGRRAMSLSHDGMIVPHPVAPGLHRACMGQATGNQADGSSAPAKAR